MKNINTYILILIHSMYLINASAQNYFKVELSIDPDLDKYNSIGLILCKINVINTDTIEHTMAFGGINDFQIKDIENNNWTGLDDGSRYNFGEWYEYLFPLPPKDTLTYLTNCSFLEFAQNKFLVSPNELSKTFECTLKVGIYCSNSDTTADFVYSNERSFSLMPLNEYDRLAFLDIYNKRTLPAKIANPNMLSGYFSRNEVLDAFILETHPLSAFSVCVKLAKVNRKANFKKVLTPEEKIELYQLLEELLKSEYSFIKYSAQKAKNIIDSK
jgi:hypothetical protein